MGDKAALRSLPGIDRLVASPRLAVFDSQLAHPVRVRLAQEWIALLRERLVEGQAALPFEAIEAGLAERYQEFLRLGVRRVINATGVLLHTNLGRAPLGRSVLDAMGEALAGYCSLEFDLARGERGERGAAVERLLGVVCGAPAALVVNNGAAAVFLILHCLGAGREVLLSRGELVQIGGGFRLPDIFTASGAILREVGTTNITRTADYERALGPQTALVLKVHQSCFVITGHAASAPLAELGALARRAGLPFVVDLGSGQLADETTEDATASTESPDLSWETIQAAGADLTCFSGDKLLGGPQAGIVLGDRRLVATLKASPLYRAMRAGKTELFLLERTLLDLAAGRKTPTEERIAETGERLRQRAEALVEWLRPRRAGCRTREGFSSIGGGTPPSRKLVTWLVELGGDDGEAIARRLLGSQTPVVVRRENKRVLIDLRTVFPQEEPALRDALEAAIGPAARPGGG
jgi:L-seryl-tRNA(Ser) seleniumtransferase